MSRLIRTAHQWLGIVFTLTVLANIVTLSLGHQIDIVTYSPLGPLFLMLLSGLYMFALPYVARRKDAK